MNNTIIASNNRRVAKNTIMLYLRMMFIVLVNLYTVRILLEILGAEDYGLYTAVAGVVLLFSFLSSSMAAATQRYFSFALGQNNKSLLLKIFNTNLAIYLLIAMIAFILLESGGLWFVNEKLKVPQERLPVLFLLKNQTFRQDHIPSVIQDHFKSKKIVIILS